MPFIQAPTLVLHGAADGLIPTRYAEDLAARIPDARLQLLANAGHLPMFDVEDAFTLAVEEFLA